MKITWELDHSKQKHMLDLEIEEIMMGDYQRNRSYILPYLPEKFRHTVLYLPKLKSFTSPLTTDYDLKELNEFSNKHYRYYKKTFDQLVLDSKEMDKKFIPLADEYFPNAKDFEIIISPKYYGNLGDYDNTQETVYIHPRYDRKLDQIYKLIVHVLVRRTYFWGENEKFKSLTGARWREKQDMARDVYGSPPFTELLGESDKGYMDFMENNSAGQLAVESAIYYKELGYPVVSLINNANEIEGLSTSEQIILQLFLENRNKIVTYDQLAAVMWPENTAEKFSLYAISKIVQRVKDKIADSGIRQQLIHAQRGEGYVLFD